MPLDTNARELLGSRLLAARRSAELSAADVAAATGSSEETIRQYERGYRLPTIDRLADLAAALRTTSSALMDGVLAIHRRNR